jgi:hypothetical protein
MATDRAGGVSLGGAGEAVPSDTRHPPIRPTCYPIIANAGDPSAVVAYYKMRGIATGPVYVTWVVSGTPDFSGTYAPSAIIAGTVVMVSTWFS